jgi:hypothetical protein
MRKTAIIFLVLVELLWCAQLSYGASDLDFKGAEGTSTRQFPLNMGLAIVEFSYSGKELFTLWLKDMNGNYVEQLADARGSIQGSVGFNIARTGTYYCEVAGKGNWTIRIKQPRPKNAQPVPVKFQGKGTAVTGFFTLNGTYNMFDIHNDGTTTFSVVLKNGQGKKVIRLAHIRGSYDGSKGTAIQNAGIYFLQVESDGKWSVEVK